MAPSVTDIIEIIEIIAPIHRAEPWDNCGLQVGNPDAPVTKIALALEPDEQTIHTAHDWGGDLLITHHPLIFPNISSIDIRCAVGKAVAAALDAGMSVYSAHTNLDHAPEGTSFALARKLSLVDPTPLPSSASVFHPQTTPADQPTTPDGIVCIGDLSSKMKLIDLARFVKESLGAATIRLVGDPQCSVSRAAVCAGSGGDFITTAHSLGADVFITGEIRYHTALSAAGSGFCVIEAGHFWSELPIISETARILGEESRIRGWLVDIMVIRGKDPFSYV
ncbi:MAG: Nif3-like dinuclear metal center hexameric protein [Deltaproteobacteria bacterium]|nr:Nif3-like dinuclear metal center hexameric protein [Candidatus Zymogenaceae bacterium]